MADKLYTQQEVDALIQAANEAALREAADNLRITHGKMCSLQIGQECDCVVSVAKREILSLIPQPSALAWHDEKIKAEFAAVMENLEAKWRTRSKSYEQPEHEEFNYEDGKLLAFNRCAEDILAAIPTDYASALDRRLADARLEEHIKCCPACIQHHLCYRVAELRRAVKGESNAKE